MLKDVFVVGIAGKLQNGKSTLADMIIDIAKTKDMSAIKFAFAGEVKRVAIDEFGWDGNKDGPGRTLLQMIGTDTGRTYNYNIWVEKLDNIISKIKKDIDIIIIDDVRFYNEIEYIKKFKNNLMIRVDLKKSFFLKLLDYIIDFFSLCHKSEQKLKAEYFDIIILNDKNCGISLLNNYAKRIFMNNIFFRLVEKKYGE